MTDEIRPDEIRPDDPARLPDETEPAGEETPGAPGSAAPMTDSTDGGLEGGDPGVEE